MRRLRRKEEKRNKAYNSVHPQGKIWKTLECFAFVRFISTDGVGYCILKSIKLSNWDTRSKIRFIFIFHLSFFCKQPDPIPIISNYIVRKEFSLSSFSLYIFLSLSLYLCIFYLYIFFQVYLCLKKFKFFR